MNIVHVSPSYLPVTRYGGPIHSVHGLCRALARSGHEVSVFTTNVDGVANSDVPLGRPVELDGVKVWYFPTSSPRRLYRSPELARALHDRVSGFDIVHLHSVFLWPTWAAARAARSACVPYLLAPRGMLVPDLVRRRSRWTKTAWLRLIERRNLERAAGIHVTTPIEQQELERFGFELPPVYCVPNGIEPVDPEPLGGTGPAAVADEPYVLFLSRVNWKKGLDRLVRAWKMVPERLLIVAGNDEEGYRCEIEQLARSEGVADRIRFIGPVYGARKWLLYRQADLFVLPSLSENFGIVVLEAMAMSCPVLVTPEVGLAPVIEEAGCGRVVDGDPQALAGAMNELLGDPAQREAMGRRGRDVVRAQFLWDDVAARMERVYREVADARS